MPRPAKKDKKPKEELVIRTPSDAFYKAFIFMTDPPEMQTDISGDTFSKTPDGAICALFASMTKDELLQIPNILWGIGFDGQSVAIDKEPNPNMKTIVMIRLHANYGAEMEDPTAEYRELSEDEFYLKLKALKEGYSMGVQDYDIRLIEIRSDNISDPSVKLTKLSLVVSDPERANPAFPETINIS